MNRTHPGTETQISIETADALAVIGTHIRDLRAQKGLTLQAMSEMTGLSPSMLSLVERGQTSPSIGSLVAISSALGVHMSELLAAGERGSPVSRAHEQPIYGAAHGVLRRILRDDRIRGVEIALNEYEPDSGSAESPTFHKGFEYGFVLEGRLTVEVDGMAHTLTPGDLISYPSSRPHRIWNFGVARARALWVNLDKA